MQLVPLDREHMRGLRPGRRGVVRQEGEAVGTALRNSHAAPAAALGVPTWVL